MASLAQNRAILDAFGDRVIERARLNLKQSRLIRGQFRNRVDTGNLKSKLTYGYFKRGPKIIQWFGVPANDTATRNYADVIEKGRTPNNNPMTWPPVGPIYQWMTRKKLFLPGSKETSKGAQAWKMAENIGRRGIVGINYMSDAFNFELRKSNDDFKEFYKREIFQQLRLKADKYIK